MRAFSDEIEAKIVARYQAGESLGDIADDMFCSPATIRNISKRLGFMRKAGWTTPDLKPADKMPRFKAIASDYASGMTLAVIAERHGYADPSGVSSALVQAEKSGIAIIWRRPRHA